MNLQRLVWFVDRFAIYAVLVILLAAVVFALSYQHGLISIVAIILFIFALHNGLVRLKIRANSVVLREGRVVFFVPETIVRNRFDFVSRGQTIVELPEYQLLDRPFRIEIFSPGREGRVSACRLSLRLWYLMQPAAWQRAYDSFVEHGEHLPLAVKKLLLKSCAGIQLKPVAMNGDDAMRNYLMPVVSHLNLALESVGLEVVDLQCTFGEEPIFARLLADDQQNVEEGVTGAVFTWQVNEEEWSQKVTGELLEVPRSVEP